MKIKVNEACIGCCACIGIASDLLEINDNGVSQAKVDVVPEGSEDAAKQAASACPVGAIEIEEKA